MLHIYLRRRNIIEFDVDEEWFWLRKWGFWVSLGSTEKEKYKNNDFEKWYLLKFTLEMSFFWEVVLIKITICDEEDNQVKTFEKIYHLNSELMRSWPSLLLFASYGRKRKTSLVTGLTHQISGSDITKFTGPVFVFTAKKLRFVVKSWFWSKSWKFDLFELEDLESHNTVESR